VWGLLHNERYVGRLQYGRMRKGYKGGTKVRTKREAAEVLTVERPDLAIITDDMWQAARARGNKTTKPWHVQKGGTPRYLLTGLAVCAECGGGIQANSSRFGDKTIPLYMCGYNHDRGPSVCTNKLRRPAHDVDEAVLTRLQEICLHPGVAQRITDAVREKLTQQAAGSDGEVTRLSKVVSRLQREVGHLTEAITIGGGVLPSLVAKLSQVQAELTSAELQLADAKSAPGVVAKGLDGLAEEVSRHLAATAALLREDRGKAKEALRRLLTGKLSFRPIETADGRRYEISGRLTIGDFQESSASPRGFERDRAASRNVA
jgi:hypothetical protein